MKPYHSNTRRDVLVRFSREKISMEDRVALVVGGTSGIGLATARRLYTAGATVHIAARGKERLDDVAASDPGLRCHQADGSNRDEIKALAEEIGTIGDQLWRGQLGVGQAEAGQPARAHQHPALQRPDRLVVGGHRGGERPAQPVHVRPRSLSRSYSSRPRSNT